MADVIPKPTHGDVVELILDDHRLFEELLRQLRDITQDRDGLRRVLSRVLVAHAEAEEQQVYPRLRRQNTIEPGEAEHGTHEHDEGHQALLTLLEIEDTGSEKFSQAVHELSGELHHHLDEEERDILNPARTDLDQGARDDLGAAFATARAAQMDADCGNVDNVRRLVERAHERSG